MKISITLEHSLVYSIVQQLKTILYTLHTVVATDGRGTDQNTKKNAAVLLLLHNNE